MTITSSPSRSAPVGQDSDRPRPRHDPMAEVPSREDARDPQERDRGKQVPVLVGGGHCGDGQHADPTQYERHRLRTQVTSPRLGADDAGDEDEHDGEREQGPVRVDHTLVGTENGDDPRIDGDLWRRPASEGFERVVGRDIPRRCDLEAPRSL